MAADILLVSCRNLVRASFGGVRRVRALVEALHPRAMVCQPHDAYPQAESHPYPVDLGRRKCLINWGIFNLAWPANRSVLRRVVAERRPALLLATSMWDDLGLPRGSALPVVYDAQNVETTAISERYGRCHPFTRLVARHEAAILRRARHVFACSPVDREVFVERFGVAADRVSVVPNGVDTDDAPQPGPLPPDDPLAARFAGRQILFFMGKLDYRPNADALGILASTVMPELERAAPGRFVLLVCGGPVPGRAAPLPAVFAGYVPQERLRRYLGAADICVAPIPSGSGTRLKILEYMAAGKPIVTTAKGTEGIRAQDGREVAIAEPSAFAGRVLALSRNPRTAAAMGDAARRLAREGYDWNRSIKPLWRGVIESLLASAGPAVEP
jgi:glycosyltransferase involved in cell wall biosynthesis